MIQLKNGKHIINVNHISYVELNEVPDFNRVDLCIYLDTKEAFIISFNTKESAIMAYNNIEMKIRCENVLTFDEDYIKKQYDIYTI